MGLIPLCVEARPFQDAFSEFKSREYALQKTLVESITDQQDASTRLRIVQELKTAAPECSETTLSALERSRGKFVGQCFYHKKYRYRGVIFKPDSSCQLGEDLIESSGVRRLPRGLDQPFYHCLVDMRDRPGGQTTYVAEENIVASEHAFDVQHPLLGSLFVGVPELRCYVGTERLERVLDEYEI